MWYFFFFQAEDGIRDVAVTGVQTCALPISGKGFNVKRVVVIAADCLRGQRVVAMPRALPVPFPQARSEERRVGKSVDLGGRRIIKKKKQTKEDERHEIENEYKHESQGYRQD